MAELSLVCSEHEDGCGRGPGAGAVRSGDLAVGRFPADGVCLLEGTRFLGVGPNKDQKDNHRYFDAFS